MNLIHELTAYCDNAYQSYGRCTSCSHPSGHCSGGCRTCSEEVNYHRVGKRTDYDCQKFLYYYVCRYSWKYSSEIIYALDRINLARYPYFNILSLGCGGSPDLMAFEQLASRDCPIFYHGYDANPFWAPIHNEIAAYAEETENIQACFSEEDVFYALDAGMFQGNAYNVVILEYLLSHFPSREKSRMIDNLIDGLIREVLPDCPEESPFLLIINDIDHYQIRDHFDYLIERLLGSGYKVNYWKRHFTSRFKDFGDGSVQYGTCANQFDIPDYIKAEYDCAINCSSAQLIIELG